MADIISANRFVLCEMLTGHRLLFRSRLKFKILLLAFVTFLSLCIPLACITELISETKISSKAACLGITGSMGGVWFAVLLSVLYGFYQRRLLHRAINSVFNQTSEPIIWRLQDNEWTSFLEHIYGRNQASHLRRRLHCWCQRRRLFAKLNAQTCGHIVLVENAILFDRLFLYHLNQNPIHQCQLITLENQHVVLRLFLQSNLFPIRNKANAYHVSTTYRQIDIFIPKVYQEPRERLDQVVALLNAPTTTVKNVIPNFDDIRALFTNG